MQMWAAAPRTHGTAAALPNGLPGEWHGVDPAVLAAAIAAFCLDA